MGPHHQHQRGSADTNGRTSLASAGFAEGGRGLAPGFFHLRCLPLGAAPRTKYNLKDMAEIFMMHSAQFGQLSKHKQNTIHCIHGIA